jgi:hypothetical protein
MPFVKGKSGNVKGRPKGILDRRLRLNKALMADGDKLLEVTKAAALAGDMNAMALLLPRMMPTLKPEGSPVRFPFDPAASLTDAFSALMEAISSGQLTIEEGQRIADMLRARAEIAALEGKDEAAARLVNAFKDIAQTIVRHDDSLPPPPQE